MSRPIEWEILAPPRRHLPLADGIIAPTVWSQNISPQWKSTLTRLILGTISNDEIHIDTLVMALTELWYSIVFCKMSSHNISELLKQVVEACASDPQISIQKSSNDVWSSPQMISAVCDMTELKSAMLDSLRWSVEYSFEGLDSLVQDHNRSSNEQSAHPSPRSSGTTTPMTKSAGSVQQVYESRVYPRILSMLEAIEKSGILTKIDIIGTIPYFQLDKLRYIVAKDNSNLLKVNVRMRTKDTFTLQVYNLESENPLGYCQLHVLIQTFIVVGTSKQSNRKCKCSGHQSKTSTTEAQLDCQYLLWLRTGIHDLIVEYSLCVNKVVEILLVYWKHWLFVLKHEMLRIIQNLISRGKLEEVGRSLIMIC